MHLLQLIAPIYTMVLIGMWLYHKGLYTKDVDKFLVFVTYYLLLPLTVFSSVTTTAVPFSKQPAIFLSLYFGLLLFFYLAYRVFYGQNCIEQVINATRGNTVYLGLPVMIHLLPSTLVPVGLVMAIIISSMNIVVVEILHSLESQGRHKLNLIGLLYNPIIAALLIGIGSNLLGVKSPFLSTTIETLTAPLVFLSLILVGGNFKHQSFLPVKAGSALAGVLISKLFIFPALFFVISLGIDLQLEYVLIGILLFATPPATTNYIVVKNMSLKGDLTIKATIIGTGLYLALLPLLGYIVNKLSI